MSNSKDIRIRWISDETEISKTVDNLQRKLQQINKNNTITSNIQDTGGTLSNRATNAQKAYQQSTQYLLQKEDRELQAKQRSENIALLGKQRELKKIESSEAAITNEKRKQIDLLKEEIALRSKNVLDIEQARNKIAGHMGGGQQVPPVNPAAGGGSGFMSFVKGLSATAIVAGGLNAYATGAGYLAERGGKISRAEGGIAQGMSRDMREQAAGRGSDAFIWANERQRAAEITRDEYKNKRYRDMASSGVRGVAGGAAGALAGAAGGAYLGGMAGAFLGLPGMAIGAGIGTVVGGISGFVGGSSLAMGKEGLTPFDKEKYDKENLADALKNREANEMAEMSKNPRKQIAANAFSKNLGKYSQLQRQLGLGDQETFGEYGFLQNQMNFGNAFGGGLLKGDDVLSSYGQLRSGSGVTSSRELAGRASAINRQMGISNAASSMGQMMGRGNDFMETNDAFKRLMAEAVSMGVNGSEMTIEMENFTKMAADMITQGGGVSDLSGQMLAGAAGDFSIGALGAAGSEFKEFQDRAGAAGGLEGQLGWGYLQSEKADEAFGKDLADKIRKDPSLMNFINQMDASSLEQDDALLTGLAEIYKGEGGDVDATKANFLKGTRSKDLIKSSRSPTGAKTLKKFGAGLEDAGGLDNYLKTEEGRVDYARAALARGDEFGTPFIRQGSQKTQAELAYASGFISKATAADLGKIDETMDKNRGTATAAGDASQAVGDKFRINEISKFADTFMTGAKKHNEAQELVNTQYSEMVEILKTSNGDLKTNLTALTEQLEKFSEKMSESGFPSSKPKR